MSANDPKRTSVTPTANPFVGQVSGSHFRRALLGLRTLCEHFLNCGVQKLDIDLVNYFRAIHIVADEWG